MSQTIQDIAIVTMEGE